MRLVRFQDGERQEYAWLENSLLFEVSHEPFHKKKSKTSIAKLEEIKLLAPCCPGKVVGLAINYEGATGSAENITEPLVFLKTSNSVCGPGEDIISPFSDVPVWGEPELAIVIGKRLSVASMDDAKSAIWGYTVANDISADNLFHWDHHLARSKAADTFCPLGPWIDTGFIPDNRKISGYQNGELIRQGNTSQRIWKDIQIVYWLSQWMTLEIWDIILTGTPPRVVPRRYLSDGDLYTAEIEGLGSFKNRFHVQVRLGGV